MSDTALRLPVLKFVLTEHSKYGLEQDNPINSESSGVLVEMD